MTQPCPRYRSHLSPVEIEPDMGGRPQPGEQLLYMKAGDTIMTHTSLLHSVSTQCRDHRAAYQGTEGQ